MLPDWSSGGLAAKNIDVWRMSPPRRLTNLGATLLSNTSNMSFGGCRGRDYQDVTDVGRQVVPSGQGQEGKEGKGELRQRKVAKTAFHAQPSSREFRM